ncbi:unnamed protein product [Victoria cruziana]
MLGRLPEKFQTVLQSIGEIAIAAARVFRRKYSFSCSNPASSGHGSARNLLSFARFQRESPDSDEKACYSDPKSFVIHCQTW